MSAQTSTYYDLLGVNHQAQPANLRSAYRKLAQRYHPDKMPGNPKAEQVMAALNQAYSVLSDPGQRAEYDSQIQELEVSRQRSQDHFAEILEDNGAAWPWYLLFATITFCAAVVGVTVYFNYVPH
jgi:DnaJ-class molecular chaperone